MIVPGHLNFGIEVTLLIAAFAVGCAIHRIDPGDNTPVAALISIAVVGAGPGATLIGKVIWPPG